MFWSKGQKGVDRVSGRGGKAWKAGRRAEGGCHTWYMRAPTQPPAIWATQYMAIFFGLKHDKR